MAIKKNKDGIMAAISAAASQSNQQPETVNRAQRSLPKGTIGSVRAGLGGIQNIATALILSWGPQDRLDVQLTAVNKGEGAHSIEELAQSISRSGQQVPVLLRPAQGQDGHFQVIYGRRRILACKQLGIPVKALIRTLDDHEAIMAKGLENATRQDLSFYERARFACAIIEQGYSRAEACNALSISKNTLSQLERIARLIPESVGNAIGPAPESGRPKWMVLASAFDEGKLKTHSSLDLLQKAPDDLNSDERLLYLIKTLNETPSKDKLEKIMKPVDGVEIKNTQKALSMLVKPTEKNQHFVNWLNQNLSQLMQDAFERYQAEEKKSG